MDPVHCSQEFTYTPDPDYNGPDSFTFTATSDGAPSVPATVTITVDPVNDDPTFTVGSDVTVDEDSGSAQRRRVHHGRQRRDPRTRARRP